MLTPPTQPHHLALKVQNLDAMVQFYSSVLLLPLVRRHTDTQGRPRSVWLQLGNLLLMLERSDASPAHPVLEVSAPTPTPPLSQPLSPPLSQPLSPPLSQPPLHQPQARSPRPDFRHDPPGWHLLALQIAREERPAWRQWLTQCQVPIEAESVFTLYFFDPEGNRLGLSHYPDAPG